MDELIGQVSVILRAMWINRRIGVAVAWVVGILGAGVVFVIPDKYEATARISVDTQTILQPLMAGLAFQPNVEQQLAMLSRTLISRPNVEKMILMAGLEVETKSKVEQEALVDRLMKTLEIRGTARDNLYSLSFRHTKPDQAQKVVESMLSIFVESSLGNTRRDSDTAKRFIDDQIKEYELKLQEAEQRLKEFKLRNVELQVGVGRTSTDRLEDISARLNAAKLELREAEDMRDTLKRQLAGFEASFGADTPEAEIVAPNPEIDGRIESMKRNLDTMLQRYTEQHPDVIGARRVIADLEERKRQDFAARKKIEGGAAAVSVSANPIYQQIRVSLIQAEARVAPLRARVAEFEMRFRRLGDSLRTQPEIEAEYAQLNRDYDVHKRNYEQLVSRRESASLSSNLEAVSGAEFRVVDPPRVSPKPVAPNRMLLLVAAFVASLGAGLGAAYLVSQIRPVFLDAKSLRDASGLPLLGTVSMVVSDSVKARERRSIWRVALAISALAGAYGAGFVALTLLAAKAA